MKIRWREIFKFPSGAALAGSFANFYLWLSGISVPSLGYTITPRLLGVRAALQFALCSVAVRLYCERTSHTSCARSASR